MPSGLKDGSFPTKQSLICLLSGQGHTSWRKRPKAHGHFR